MSKAIVVYGSTMGNTEELANSVNEVLASKYEVTLKNVIKASVEELKDYELVVLASSTWGAGELQDDFIDFYDDLAGLSLAGKNAAVFGTGDRAYGDMFCQAVDMLEERLKENGATLVEEGFRVDGDIIDQVVEDIKEWAGKL